MTVHDKLDELLNKYNTKFDLITISQQWAWQHSTDWYFDYTFVKDYKNIFVIIIGGRDGYQTKITDITLSNNVPLIIDYEGTSSSTWGSNTQVASGYVAHTEEAIQAGTNIHATLQYNSWPFRTVIILGA